MKVRTLLIIGVLLAFVALSINAALRTPPLLSTKEVRELVAKPESPEVHFKLILEVAAQSDRKATLDGARRGRKYLEQLFRTLSHAAETTDSQ